MSRYNLTVARAALYGGLIFNDAGASEQRLAALEAELEALVTESEAVIAAADADGGRDFSEAELAKINDFAGKKANLEKQITARKALTAASASAGRRAAAEPVATGGDPRRATAVQPRPAGEAGRGGFRSFGEFAVKVRAANAGSQPDARLLNAASTYGDEGTGSDGGFAVPPDFRRDIWQKVLDQENLMTRCASLVTGANSVTIPKDETTPWQTSAGIIAYWEAEAAAVTASKPLLQMLNVRLCKLMALVPVSEELLDDATGLESWLRAKAPAKMTAKINTGIVRGTGVGQPLGILKAPSLISVTKETSQPANTIYFANINKMWARMYAPSRRGAVWLINQDIEPQLDAMAFDPAATSKVPVYLPPGGVSNSPYASLKGRPVVPVEACSTLSAQGDIILVDLQQYWAITKGTEVRTDVSMHLYFDQGLQAFRFTFRINGQPMWGSSITPENGSNTRSWAVTLDAR